MTANYGWTRCNKCNRPLFATLTTVTCRDCNKGTKP